MAALNSTGSVTLLNAVPTLRKTVTIVGDDSDTSDITHGESRAPDYIFTQITAATAPATVICVPTSGSTATQTTVTVESGGEVSATLLFEWIPQARTDGQSIDSDNNT